MSELLRAGRIGRPHGLDGSFHVNAPSPRLLAVGMPVRVGQRRSEIVRRAGTDERPVVRLALAGDRDAAQALRGEELLVERAHAPSLPDDEFWVEDLVGCRVVGHGDEELGVVRRVVALPSCEALELAGDVPLVPLVRDAVRHVDVRARRIQVDPAFLGM